MPGTWACGGSSVCSGLGTTGPAHTGCRGGHLWCGRKEGALGGGTGPSASLPPTCSGLRVGRGARTQTARVLGPHSSSAQAGLGELLTWAALVAAGLAVHAVVTAGVEAFHSAHLALPALPGALRHRQLAQGLGAQVVLGWACPQTRDGPPNPSYRPHPSPPTELELVPG